MLLKILVSLLFFAIIVPDVFCVLRRPLQCTDLNNRAVEWFIIYKLPKKAEGSFENNLVLEEGTGYLQATELSPDFSFYQYNITSPDCILSKTLEPLYEKNKDEKLEWILYNDQPPNKPYISDFGHAKGVLLFNDVVGIWLVHSVPHFPPEPDAKYEYPKTGYKYGQNILCISIGKKEFDNIGLQLKFNEINVYSYKISNETATLYPNLADAARQVRINDKKQYRQTQILTTDGMEMQSFAKTTKWGGELWSDLVAPSLNVSLYVESWLNEPNSLNSTCTNTKNTVKNVKTVAWTNNDHKTIWFKSSKDHSKWATAVDFHSLWVCIGDINRAESQFKRGGGAVCFANNIYLMRMYHGLAFDVEDCPKEKIQ